VHTGNGGEMGPNTGIWASTSGFVLVLVLVLWVAPGGGTNERTP